MIAAIIVAVTGWLLAAAMWIWAVAEQDRANDEQDRADAAELGWLKALIDQRVAERRAMRVGGGGL